VSTSREPDDYGHDGECDHRDESGNEQPTSMSPTVGLLEQCFDLGLEFSCWESPGPCHRAARIRNIMELL
jgi:hypothetical protein